MIVASTRNTTTGPSHAVYGKSWGVGYSAGHSSLDSSTVTSTSEWSCGISASKRPTFCLMMTRYANLTLLRNSSEYMPEQFSTTIVPNT